MTSSHYKQLTTQFGNVDAADSARPFISFLDAATAILKETKELAFEMLRLEPGARVLDVGCGPGDDARRLAELVGRDGYVCGIDVSKLMVAEARTRVAGEGSRVNFAGGDVQRLPLHDAAFDVCRADRVLQHVNEPLRALTEMARVVRPGGRVMVLDADHGMTAVSGGERASTRAIMDLFQRNLRNPWIGRQLPGFFRACGLKGIETRIVPLSFPDLQVASALVDFKALARQAVEEHLVTESAASRWLDDLAAQHAAGGFLLVFVGFMILGHR